MQDALPDDSADRQIAVQLEGIIHRVKQSMNYRGSYSTRDILGSLVARWVRSGEWDRLKQLPAHQRRLGESVRRFILDRFDQLRARGERMDLDVLVLPEEPVLVEMVELAELRVWISARIGDLEASIVDKRVVIPMHSPVEIGRVLRLHLDGRNQRQIASELQISLGTVNKRIVDGTRYLILLQGLECGLA